MTVPTRPRFFVVPGYRLASTAMSEFIVSHSLIIIADTCALDYLYGKAVGLQAPTSTFTPSRLDHCGSAPSVFSWQC